MFIKSLFKSCVCMSSWEDVLAPCPIGVTPYIVLKARANEDAKDRIMDVLRNHYIPFILLGDILVSCRFAIIFEKTTHYTSKNTNTTNHAIIHIDPPSDRVRQAIEFIFNLLRETGFEFNMSVDDAVNEYNKVIKAFTCLCQ